MKVLKFGGTSVGSSSSFKAVANIVNNNEKTFVVLSAMSGTTNKLVEISELLHNKKQDEVIIKILQLEDKYYKVVNELFSSKEILVNVNELVASHFNYIKSFTQDIFTVFEEKAILAQGELISTALFHYYLKEQKINSVLISALNFMRIDKQGEPDEFYIRENLKRELDSVPEVNIYISQGFICRNAFGEIDNLKRGGSDYSASIIGQALNVDEIQIWTDIDGMHNNDPRIVENTKPLAQISFDEAAELAYFGAKILHPSSVLPAKNANIPVILKNTMDPEAEGTLISSTIIGEGIKAIAAKDNITAIKIKSDRMLLAHGFMRKVFEIFETYKTSIDMITTSEVAVSVTIDDIQNLHFIVEELKHFGTVEVDKNLTIISIIGNFLDNSKGYALKIFDSLQDISIRMISYGGSRHNVSILVNTKDKKEAMISLHNKLF
jgi:aspartate kinase